MCAVSLRLCGALRGIVDGGVAGSARIGEEQEYQRAGHTVVYLPLSGSLLSPFGSDSAWLQTEVQRVAGSLAPEPPTGWEVVVNHSWIRRPEE